MHTHTNTHPLHPPALAQSFNHTSLRRSVELPETHDHRHQAHQAGPGRPPGRSRPPAERQPHWTGPKIDFRSKRAHARVQNGKPSPRRRGLDTSRRLAAFHCLRFKQLRYNVYVCAAQRLESCAQLAPKYRRNCIPTNDFRASVCLVQCAPRARAQ